MRADGSEVAFDSALMVGSRIDGSDAREIASLSLGFCVVGLATEPINFRIAPVGVSSMVDSIIELDGTGFKINWLKLVVDACRLTVREFLFDGEIKEVERRKDEADGLGKGVDAENPVDWPNGYRISCSI